MASEAQKAARRRRKAAAREAIKTGKEAADELSKVKEALEASKVREDGLRAERDHLRSVVGSEQTLRAEASKKAEEILNRLTFVQSNYDELQKAAEFQMQKANRLEQELINLRSQDAEAKPLRERLHRKSEELKEVRVELGQEIVKLKERLTHAGINWNTEAAKAFEALKARGMAILSLLEALKWCGKQECFKEGGSLKAGWEANCAEVVMKVESSIKRVPATSTQENPA